MLLKKEILENNRILKEKNKELKKEIEKLREENNLLKQIIGNDKKYSYGIRMVSDEK